MKLTAETTIFNDDKVQQKFSELIVDADGIRTEVSKKVGNDEIISRIRQSAEAVKIQASKIEIDGVITAINNNTTTSIDGDKIATGSLSANRVDANSGTFNTANIPNLSADKITTGTIKIGQIPTTARNDTYITDIGNDGIRVHDSHTTNNSVVINSDGMEVFKGGTTSAYSLAKYGDTVRIGSPASTNLNVETSAITLKEGDSTKGRIDLVTNDAVGLYSSDGATGIAARADDAAGWVVLLVHDEIRADDCTFTASFNGLNWTGPNTVLWQGAPNYMGSGQSIALSDTVNNQLTGIVLVWSRYADGAAKNDSWSYQFIPKWHVNVHDTEGVYFSMPISNTSNTVCNKYVYVEDAMISGHADNTATGTGYANNTRVLRAVLGV